MTTMCLRPRRCLSRRVVVPTTCTACVQSHGFVFTLAANKCGHAYSESHGRSFMSLKGKTDSCCLCFELHDVACTPLKAVSNTESITQVQKHTKCLCRRDVDMHAYVHAKIEIMYANVYLDTTWAYLCTCGVCILNVFDVYRCCMSGCGCA